MSTAPRNLKLTGFLTALTPEPEGEQNSPRRFTMRAYTGAEVRRLFGNAIFELSGIELPDQVPILLNHDEDQIAGFADTVKMKDGGLQLEGVLLTEEDAGAKVARLSDSGLKWKASMSVDVLKWEQGEKGDRVNGQELSGRVNVARKSKLVESSFVPVGADASTSAEALAYEEGNVGLEQLKVQNEELKAELTSLKAELDGYKAREAERLEKARADYLEHLAKASAEAHAPIPAKELSEVEKLLNDGQEKTAKLLGDALLRASKAQGQVSYSGQNLKPGPSTPDEEAEAARFLENAIMGKE